MGDYSNQFRCSNCNKRLDPWRDPVCPRCGKEQSLEERATALGAKIVDIECPKCGNKKSLLTSDEYLDAATCPNCLAMTYASDEGKKVHPKPNLPPTVHCPYCNSVNTSKISKVSKAGSVALFGVFAVGKISKQWHCNNCKSDF